MDINDLRKAEYIVKELTMWKLQLTAMKKLKPTSHALILDEEFNSTGSNVKLPVESKKIVLALVETQLDKKIADLEKQFESL